MEHATPQPGTALSPLVVAWLALVALTLFSLVLGQWFHSAAWLQILVAAIVLIKGHLIARRFIESELAHPASCHGPKGLGTPQLPRLAGQHPRYIEDQLKQFNSRERNNDNAVMHTVASKLSELERHAVAEYIATLN